MVSTKLITLLITLLIYAHGQTHRLCTGNCDNTCYEEFSKYDANAFLSSGKRSTPRECCHESYCEQQGIRCKTEQYRSYIVNKFSKSCPAGQTMAVMDYCMGHYTYECRGVCQALGRERCENGGTCVPDGAKYTCSCMPGFRGQFCHVDVDDCNSNPCNLPTSTGCVDGVNDYSCQCNSGYTGKTCLIDINECASFPCRHGGNCTDNVDGFACTCAPGYTGPYCETDIDECASSPCQNGATCNDMISRFTCDCPPRIYGVHCDTSICHPTPADVVFVLDSSISMTEQQFKKELEFVANFSSNVPIGPRDFQISVVTFSFNAHVEFYLNEYADNSSLIDAVMNITYKPGATFTDKGLRAVTSVFSSGHGIERRINGTQADRFVYILTDGMSTDRIETKIAATELTTYVDTIAVIGIGNQVSHQELMDIATSRSFVYSVNNFNSLYTVLKRLVHFDCDECKNSAESDVAIFLDSSSDMSSGQYDASKDAIIHIIDVMKQLSVNETRVSITSFSDVILGVFKMGEAFNKDVIKSTVNRINQRKEHAQLSIVKVFSYARTHIFNNKDSRASGKKFLLIFTNGQLETTNVNELSSEKEMLEANGVHIIAVGSGDGLYVRGLLELVTDAFNVFIASKDSLKSNLDVLQSEFVYNKCDFKGE